MLVVDARAAEPASTKPTTTAATSQPVIDKTTQMCVAKVFLSAECDLDLDAARDLSIEWGKRDSVLRAFGAKMNGQVQIDAALSAKFGNPPARKPGDHSPQAKRAFEAL